MIWLIFIGLVFLLLLIFSLCKISSIGDKYEEWTYNAANRGDENENN